MPSFLHHPTYEDFPLQLSQGFWLHSSRWEPTDFEFFTSARSSIADSMLAPPKFYRHKRRKTPSLDAMWVLKTDEKSSPLGWAELQSFPGKRFSKVFLFFAMGELSLDRAQEALIVLISLVFTLSRHDHLHIAPGTADRARLDALAQHTGTLETFMSLPGQAWHPDSGPSQERLSLAVDRSSWRSCSTLQNTLRSMKHIEMRLERLDRLQKDQPKKPKKRPFLLRLFKPKIDDSLF